VRVKKSIVDNKLYLRPQHFFSHFNHTIPTAVIQGALELIVLAALLREPMNSRLLIVPDLHQEHSTGF
jgi:hypothetical protein